MDIFKNWRKKNSKKIYRCERKFKNSKLIDWPYRKNEDLELKQNKNMENKEKTPWNIMVTDNYMPNGTEHTIGINLFCRLVAHMMKNNLIIDVEAGYLAFKEKENMRTEIKPNGEVYLHIHSLLKEVKELHIPPVDQETDIKSQVIDIITKALQEAKIKTDGTK